jgi:hypothetical protein
MRLIINLFLLLIFFLLDDGKEDKEEQAIKEILIEKHNEAFFAWIKENNTFIGQAKTPEDLYELLRSKFPKQNIKLITSGQQQ